MTAAAEAQARKREIERRLKELKSGVEEVESITVNGVIVEKGAVVSIRTEKGVLQQADAWAGLPARSNLDYVKDDIYLGETGKVVRCLKKHGGVEGAVALELQFVDETKHIFVEGALAVGEPQAVVPKRGQTGPTANTQNTSSKTAALLAAAEVEPEEERAPEVLMPVQMPTGKPGSRQAIDAFRKTSPAPSSRSSGVVSPVALPPPPTTSAAARAGAADKDSGSNPSTPVTPYSPFTPFNMTQREYPAAESPRGDITAEKKKPNGTTPSHQKPIPTRHADPQPAHEEKPRAPLTKAALDSQRRTSADQSAIPQHCPKDYKSRHPLEESDPSANNAAHNHSNGAAVPTYPGSRIPRFDGAKPPNTAGSKVSEVSSSAASTKTVPSPAKPAARPTSPALRTGASRPTAKPAAKPSTTSVSSGVKRCTLTTTTGVRGETDAKSVIIRSTHTGMVALRSLCTRELGWGGATGRRVERVFDRASGDEITDPAMILDGMSLVATGGESFTPAPLAIADRPRKTSNAGAPATTQPSTGSRRASATATGPAAASAGIQKAIVLRVYANGEYGDTKHDRVPFRTVAIRSTHKTLASVLSTVTRELGWSKIGRKAELLYDASGAEVGAIGELKDGGSIVASSGDRFVVPMASTMLYQDLMHQVGESPTAPGPAATTGAARSSTTPSKAARPSDASAASRFKSPVPNVRRTSATTTPSKVTSSAAVGNRERIASEVTSVGKKSPTPASTVTPLNRAEQLRQEIAALENQMA